MNTVGTLQKLPNEVRVFTMDWSAQLGPDAIANSSWTITPNTATILQSYIATETLTTIRVEGGVSGVNYILTNTITTSNSETLIESGTLHVR